MADVFTLSPGWAERLQKFLKHGSVKFNAHNTPSEGTCVMEAVAFIAGDDHSDHPKCTAWSLSNFAIWINDQMGNAAEGTRLRNKLLKPVIPELLNTSSKKQRRMHRYDYSEEGTRIVSDAHDDKVNVFLCKEIARRFGGDYTSREPADMIYYYYRHAPDKKAFFSEAVEVLRAGARYAKQLLGEDVNMPVTVFASEYTSPGYGDSFVDDLKAEDVITDPIHEEIHV